MKLEMKPLGMRMGMGSGGGGEVEVEVEGKGCQSRSRRIVYIIHSIPFVFRGLIR
jgi:hypothetical protein